MRSWLGKLWAWRKGVDEAPVAPAEERSTPPWAVAMEEQLRKVARAQSKLSLRLDELMHVLDERLPSARADAAAAGPEPDPGPVLDALDRLDQARRTVADEHPALAQGLASITARLEGFLGAMGVERRTALGMPVDPTLFRVVGVDRTSAEANDGLITRVVRAAVLRGARLIREGEVFVGATPHDREGSPSREDTP